MTPKQQTAIKQLEQSFNSCKKAGLSFCGMDNLLYAYDKKKLTEAEQRLHCLYDAQQEAMNNKPRTDYVVNTHGAYLDSGGW